MPFTFPTTSTSVFEVIYTLVGYILFYIDTIGKSGIFRHSKSSWQKFSLGDIATEQVLVKPAHVFDRLRKKRALLIVVVAR